MLKDHIKEEVFTNKRNTVKEWLAQEESLALEMNHNLGAAWAMQ